jgi:peptide/nickel transport system substrate-binding protein
MSKLVLITRILSLLLIGSASVMPLAFSASPPVSRQMGFIEETIEGGGVNTVDYSISYDTASGELIGNMMDTLITYDGERTDQFLPAIGSNWIGAARGSGGSGIDSGLSVSGLLFENMDNQTGPHANYYYRYTFEIRSGVRFQPPYNFSLTPADVAFSFQRTLLMDVMGGPAWMLQEPLLDIGSGSLSQMEGYQGADLTNATQVAELGALIEHSVEYNETHVWFNLMHPSAYAPFMHILAQTWSSIESKQWINEVAIGVYGRDTWPGDWSNITSWLHYRNPDFNEYPLDTPTPIMYGSGPFIMTTLDYSSNFWSGVRNVEYWRGWPADFPAMSGSYPAGYVDTIYVTWACTWPTRLNDLATGAADFVAVPRQYLSDVYKDGPPYDPNQIGGSYTIDGVRCIQPLPMLSVDAFFFTVDINPATSFGPIGPAGAFGETLIPSDFFGNQSWGTKVRQAFAQAFDWETYISTVYLGEATHPPTAIIPGLNYYDPTVTGWSYDLAAANALLNQVGPDSNGHMLKDVGFTLTLVYIIDGHGLTACSLLQTAIQSLNSRFHVNIVYVSWSSYLQAAAAQKLPMFSMGWLADYPDAHDLALPFYRTGGTFSTWQAYSNPEMDALIDQGFATPDGPARQAIYHDVQVIAVQDCPSFTLDQAIGRHFERDWVVDWYCNPSYGGLRFYGLWKWYYQAEAQLSIAQNPPAVPSMLAGWNLPVDVNYDGKVDMRDIGIVAKAFGTTFGPPQGVRWVYRADINNDRVVNMKDIGLAARQFGRNSSAWVPSSVLVAISPGASVYASPMAGVGLDFANVTAWGYVTGDASLTAPEPLNDSKGPYYLISVSASFVDVTVSLAFDGSNMTEMEKSNLKMMQYSPSPEPGWMDITLYVDTENNVIYGQTTHFSFIGIH